MLALHVVLQVAFGWQNSDLHDFQVGDIRFGMADVEDEMFCVDERACPPEDCGGSHGYGHMLQVLANTADEHENVKRWAPCRFEAEKFDLVAVNKKLVTLSRRLKRGRG
ncbi:MAG TPA: hypothetical protein VEK07_21050 [Polyangiaceae bacterium]|nr:hypothetical protein [Polyangiaceae bacterium]